MIVRCPACKQSVLVADMTLKANLHCPNCSSLLRRVPAAGKGKTPRLAHRIFRRRLRDGQ